MGDVIFSELSQSLNVFWVPNVLKDVEFTTWDEQVILVDVEDLFSSRKEALFYLVEWLLRKSPTSLILKRETGMRMKLTGMCMSESFLTLTGKLYKGTIRVAMGNTMLAFLSDIFTDKIENDLLCKGMLLKIWTLSTRKSEGGTSELKIYNGDDDGELPLLNLWIIKGEKGSLLIFIESHTPNDSAKFEPLSFI